MRRSRLRAPAGAGLCLLLCAAAAMGQSKPEAAKPSSGVAAMVGGEPITMEELDARALGTNMKLAQSLYDARKAALDDLLMERLLGPEAAEKSTTVEKLLEDRLAEKSRPVTDADVEQYYNANKARIRNRTLEQVSGQIRSFLEAQRRNDARAALLTELKAEADVKVLLDAPRMKVAVAPNAPAKGPSTAEVTIVEFSEFQ